MGMNGFLAGEYIASGLEQAAAGERALQAAREYGHVVDQLIACRGELKLTEEANAANLAEKHALRAALRKRDPKHPLLTNISLQERIKDAGEAAFSLTRNWDAAREVGESFPVE